MLNGIELFIREVQALGGSPVLINRLREARTFDEMRSCSMLISTAMRMRRSRTSSATSKAKPGGRSRVGRCA